MCSGLDGCDRLLPGGLANAANPEGARAVAEAGFATRLRCVYVRSEKTDYSRAVREPLEPLESH